MMFLQNVISCLGRIDAFFSYLELFTLISSVVVSLKIVYLKFMGD